jgi:membrane-bound lytic murein transglycosylase B
MHRRAGRAAGALSVVAFAAFGQQTGPALAVGTVAETQPSTSVSDTLYGPYAAAEVAGPTAVAATTTTTATTAAALTDDATPTVSPAAPDGTGIPSTVLAAYRAAEAALAASDPSCRLPWNLVAGIGRVESGHASGGRVDGVGTTNGRILGPRLDGTTVGTATIRDTDGGTLDGDVAFDRAVGPMQFIPGTWQSFAKDGNKDGVASPHNVFDAAVAAGTYLCAGGGDLSQPAAQRAALLRYNRSDAYGALVLRWAAAYGAGVAVLPDGTGTVPSTTPTPPAQVPAPANTTLDPAVVNALAAAPPTVTGPAASESDGGTVVTTTVTTTPTTSSSTSTTTSTTTSVPVTTSTSTTTPTTSTSTSTTTPTTTSSTSTTSTTTSTTTTTTSSSATSTQPEETETEEITTKTSEPDEEPSAAALSSVASDDEDSDTDSDAASSDESEGSSDESASDSSDS